MRQSCEMGICQKDFADSFDGVYYSVKKVPKFCLK